MSSARRTGPVWGLLRLVLPALVAVLAAGCLLQAGKGASAALATDLPAAISDVQALPDGSAAGTDQGHCAKKKAAAEPSQIAPAAGPAPALPAMTAMAAARLAGAAWRAPRSGPAPPPPDLHDLRVLRI